MLNNHKIKLAIKKFLGFNDGVKKPQIKTCNFLLDDVVYALGNVEAIIYRADTADGKNSRYIHEFKKSSQPHLAVSVDGKQIYIVGGRYIVNENGINDR